VINCQAGKCYSGQVRKIYTENPRCWINHKDLKNFQSHTTHFYKYVIKRRPVSAPTWAVIKPKQYKEISKYRNKKSLSSRSPLAHQVILKKYMPRIQSKNSTTYRYINLQEIYSINSSTDQFTSYSYTDNNTALSTAKCSYLPLHQYVVTFLIYFFNKLYR